MASRSLAFCVSGLATVGAGLLFSVYSLLPLLSEDGTRQQQEWIVGSNGHGLPPLEAHSSSGIEAPTSDPGVPVPGRVPVPVPRPGEQQWVQPQPPLPDSPPAGLASSARPSPQPGLRKQGQEAPAAAAPAPEKRESAPTAKPVAIPADTSVPVFWMSSGSATVDAHMEKTLQAGGVTQVFRVEAVGAATIKDLVSTQALKLACHLGDDDCPAEQVAATLSHRKALQAATRGQWPYAVILEADAEVVGDFMERLLELVAAAGHLPWQVLQLRVDSPTVSRWLTGIREPWVQWSTHHRGFGAYAITREASLQLLEKSSESSDGYRDQGSQVVSLPQDPFPDWWVGSTTRSYTATRFLVNVAQSFVGDDKDRAEIRKLIEENPPVVKYVPPLPPKTKILALTVVKDKPEKRKSRVAILLNNAKAMAGYGTSWRATVLLDDADSSTLEAARQDWQHLTKPAGKLVSLDFVTLKGDDQEFAMNKWFFYAKSKSQWTHYSEILLCDSDMDFVAFPFLEFMARRRSVTTANGVPVVNMVSGSSRDTPGGRRGAWPAADSYFSHQRRQWWSNCGRENTTSVRTPLCEQYFVVLDAGFANYFFDRLGKYPRRKSAWGPDALWCGAAAKFIPGGACQLIPLHIRHMDSKTITSRSDVKTSGSDDLNYFLKEVTDWGYQRNKFHILSQPTHSLTKCGPKDGVYLPPDYLKPPVVKVPR